MASKTATIALPERKRRSTKTIDPATLESLRNTLAGAGEREAAIVETGFPTMGKAQSAAARAKRALMDSFGVDVKAHAVPDGNTFTAAVSNKRS